MQSIGRVGVPKHDHQGSIEEFGAVHLDLVCIRIPGELGAVTLEVKNVQACTLISIQVTY